MGAYLATPVSLKEVDSGECRSLGIKWSSCSMQGWRVGMEDAHVVLYARKISCLGLGKDNDYIKLSEKSSAGRGQLALSQAVAGVSRSQQQAVKAPECYMFLDSVFTPCSLNHVRTPTTSSNNINHNNNINNSNNNNNNNNNSNNSNINNNYGEPLEKRGFSTDVEDEVDGDETLDEVRRSSSMVNKFRQFKMKWKDNKSNSLQFSAASPSAAGAVADNNAKNPTQNECAKTEAIKRENVNVADICIFGVFDGHGGAHVSRYVGYHLPEALSGQPSFHNGLFGQALRNAYLQIDETLRLECSQDELLFLSNHKPEELSQRQMRMRNGNLCATPFTSALSEGVEAAYDDGGQPQRKTKSHWPLWGLPRASRNSNERDKAKWDEGEEGLDEGELRVMDNCKTQDENSKVGDDEEDVTEIIIDKDKDVSGLPEQQSISHRKSSESPVRTSRSSGQSSGSPGHSSGSSGNLQVIDVQSCSLGRKLATSSMASLGVSTDVLLMSKSSSGNEDSVFVPKPNEESPECTDKATATQNYDEDNGGKNGNNSNNLLQKSCSVGDIPGRTRGNSTPRQSNFSKNNNEDKVNFALDEDYFSDGACNYEGEESPSNSNARKNRKGGVSGFFEGIAKTVGLWKYFGKSHPVGATAVRSLATSSGCTAITVCISLNEIVVANLGDSRCVLSRKGEVIQLSRDHKPHLQEERLRIYAAGGYLEMGRVNGNLNLSRALGDLMYKQDPTLTPDKQIVSAWPDLTTLIRDPDDEFLIVGCDGIWELHSSSEVVEFVRLRMSRDVPLDRILEELFDSLLSPNPTVFEYGCDNMTAFLVDLRRDHQSHVNMEPNGAF